MAQMHYRGYTICTDVITHHDIRKYHGGCIVICPHGTQTTRIASSAPYTSCRKEALRQSLLIGIEVIRAGEI